MAVTLIALRAFKDNYIWLWHEDQYAWVVDPGEAAPVHDYLAQHQLQLAGVLLTHHHADHSGGIIDLLQTWPQAEVYGSYQSKIEAVTQHVREGDEIQCGFVTLKVMEIPGHTLDHTAFYNDDVLFCGDTLFSAGCGRVFEGTYAQMYQSLMKLTHLPDTVKIYCGHEYTMQNLMFANAVEPDNFFIQQKILAVKNHLLHDEPSLPSMLADEKAMNPFLRCEEPVVIAAATQHTNQITRNAVDVFRILREWKNNFV